MKLREFCDGIKQFEGWYPGSRSWRNKNPGNLKGSPYQKSADADGFSMFDSEQLGMMALERDVRKKCMGETANGLGPTSTIFQFFKTYAPSIDKNRPDNYARFVAQKCGLSPADTLDKVYTLEPVVQKILCVVVNHAPLSVSLKLLEEWFEEQGIETVIDTVDIQEMLSFVILPNVKAPVVSPDQVKALVTPHIKDHHFVVFCYPLAGANTPIEYPQLYLGANIVQIPVDAVNTALWLWGMMVHELLHGWGFRAETNGRFQFPYDEVEFVHKHSFEDTRPEVNYAAVVNEWRPYMPIIFRTLTLPEKKIALQEAIGFLWSLLALLPSWIQRSR